MQSIDLSMLSKILGIYDQCEYAEVIDVPDMFMYWRVTSGRCAFNARYSE